MPKRSRAALEQSSSPSEGDGVVPLDFTLEDEDLPFEEDVLAHPFSIKAWWRYIELKKSAPEAVRNGLWERAVSVMPGHYKLWTGYCADMVSQTTGAEPESGKWGAANAVFERALTRLHKFPRVWLNYLDFLTTHQPWAITHTRRTFDRALKSLAITQHSRVWTPYLAWASKPPVPAESAHRIYRRAVKLDPSYAEEYVDYLAEAGLINEAVSVMAGLVNDPHYESVRGKSPAELWHGLTALFARDPGSITSVDVDAVLRAGLARFPAECGKLWASLAEYYTSMGAFERARDVYEEAMDKVNTVRDFYVVFEAHAQFAEALVSASMAALDKAEAEVAAAGESGGDVDGLMKKVDQKSMEVELHLARLESLTTRRPFLVNSVLLRQNPNNVFEWLKRAALHGKDAAKAVKVYEEAVKTVDPVRATGRAYKLWLSWGRYLENKSDVVGAKKVYEQAVTSGAFKGVDDIASVWSEYIELVLRQGDSAGALALVGRATARTGHGTDAGVRGKAWKATKLWALRADLEECFGTMQSVRAVYNAAFSARVVTPALVLTFARYLAENRYFEDAFQTYEKGLGLFRWPVVYDIWVAYLDAFVARYKARKLERARDLFEQAVDGAPADKVGSLYLRYARMEESYGRLTAAMSIYGRAVKAVAPSARAIVYRVFLARTAQFYGLTATRDVYEAAVDACNDDEAREFVSAWAALEERLGEVDRARALYVHGSQWAHPREHRGYWKAWEDFEKSYGNPDTFVELVRVRRSVETAWSTDSVSWADRARVALANSVGGRDGGQSSAPPPKPTPPAQSETSGFTSGGTLSAAELGGTSEKLDLDDDDSDDDDDEQSTNQPSGAAGIQQREVPAAVFGGQ